MKLFSRGHEVELVDHRELVDPDGTLFHQFTFAVDGRLTSPWEVPSYHRLRFPTDDDFHAFLGRTAVEFSKSQYNEVRA